MIRAASESKPVEPLRQAVRSTEAEWSDWFDRDDERGSGDWEKLHDLQRAHPEQLCRRPLDIQVNLSCSCLSSLQPLMEVLIINDGGFRFGFFSALLNISFFNLEECRVTHLTDNKRFRDRKLLDERQPLKLSLLKRLICAFYSQGHQGAPGTQRILKKKKRKNKLCKNSL